MRKSCLNVRLTLRNFWWRALSLIKMRPPRWSRCCNSVKRLTTKTKYQYSKQKKKPSATQKGRRGNQTLPELPTPMLMSGGCYKPKFNPEHAINGGGKEAHLSVRSTQPAAARSSGQDFSAGCSLHRHRHSCLGCKNRGLSDLFSADESTIVDAESQLVGNLAKVSLLSSDPLPRCRGIPRHSLPRSSTSHYIQMLHSFHLSRQQLSALFWASWRLVRELTWTNLGYIIR